MDSSPMTSVALVLLILFMVVTPAITGERHAKARTADVVPKNGITVGVDRNGKFYLDDKPVADAAFAVALERAFSDRPSEHRLYVDAADEVEYSRILNVLDAARAAKIRRVTAVVDLPHTP